MYRVVKKVRSLFLIAKVINYSFLNKSYKNVPIKLVFC